MMVQEGHVIHARSAGDYHHPCHHRETLLMRHSMSIMHNGSFRMLSLLDYRQL